MAGSGSFENPLVPNARLKQMLLAMHRARAVDRALPIRRRAGLSGLEACLVAPAIDLDAQDLVSDALHGPAIAFLRGGSLHTAFEPGFHSRKKAGLADAGRARPLESPARSQDRLWMALGAATALRAFHRPADEQGNSRAAALVCYLRAGQLAPALLDRAFQFSTEHRLPVLFVALPASVKDNAAGVMAVGRLAARAGIPAISADRSDAVAIYRVAQESLGRARSGGGPALIECVPFALRGARAAQTGNPLAVIEDYVLERRIVTPGWIARESRAFARHLPDPVH